MSIENFEKELSVLNENQRQAVVHQDGPLFVVAGAGTGKTKALTTRIAYLIRVLNVDPNKILGVTFTNKAAKEVRQRVDSIISPLFMGSWLQTFHAFGLKVLRMYVEELNLGYNNSFTVIDTDDTLSVIRDITKKLNIDPKQYPPRLVMNVISNNKTKIELISDSTMHKLNDAYTAYLIKEQLMDFDDLIVYTHKLLLTSEKVRTRFQQQFEHVLIDEFQDTDLIQYEIIKLLNNKNTFVVGDPDQSIYAFRGARYENNELFLKEFKAKQIVLDENYRSTNNILKAANKLIKNNRSRTTEKNLVSSYGDGLPVVVRRAASDFEEADNVVNEIYNLKIQGYKYSDIAVLYRNNVLSRLFEHSLIQNHIPYIIYGGLSYYERKEVKDILAYLQSIIDLKSNFYIKRIINVPARGVGNVSFGKLEEYANMYDTSILDSIDYVNIGGKAKTSLIEFKEMMLSLRHEINEVNELVDVIDLVFNKTGYKQMLLDNKDDRTEDRILNIMELKTVFRRGGWNFEGSNLEKIKAILDEISLFTDKDTDLKDDNVVKLATIHQVKGLEFKVVFIVGMEDGIFPNDKVYGDNFELEEERRVFYVALTRAKERLYITHSERRMLYGQPKFSDMSLFLREIAKDDSRPTKTYMSPKTNEVEQPKTQNRLLEGDMVTHDVFGDGLVVEIRGDIASIAFDVQYGIKKLLSTHPSIKKK